MTAKIDIEDPNRKVKATEAVSALAEKHGGTITPEIVLEEAKRKSSPLHSFFCWDNTEAANEYRRIQAAMLIRRIKVTYHKSDTEKVRVRAFINVMEPEPDPEDDQEDIPDHGVNARQKGIYVTVDQAMKVDSYRDQMVRQCKRDIATFESKYAALTEVAEIIDAMANVKTKLDMD